MNKYQLYTLGGALLAATSLSGAANAASVGLFKTAAFSTTGIRINNAAFSTTATTANAVEFGYAAAAQTQIAIAFTNTYDHTFNLNVTIPITGATYLTAPAVSYITRQPNGSYFGTTTQATSFAGGAAPTVSALSNTIFISNIDLTGSASTTGNTSANIGGVALDGVTFSNASGLATVGGTVSIGATVVSQTNANLVYETAASTAIITAAAPLSIAVASGTATVAVGSSTSQFTTFTTSTYAGSLSLTLATVSITSTGTVGTDLSTPIAADSGTANMARGSESVSVTLSSNALKDAAATRLFVTAGAATQALNTTLTQYTPAIFSGGSVTFTLSAGSASYATSFNIQLGFDGSTAISAATTAGTVNVVLNGSSAAGGSSVVSPGSGSGAASTISRGGLSTEVSWANAGTGSGFTSYVRIHNKGTTAATATIIVTKDTTDGSAISTLGTVTTDSVAAGGTIQVGVPAIESSLGINSSTAGGSYTLRISGGFPGYVQHLSYNGSSLFDLSGFRNGSDGTSSAP